MAAITAAIETLIVGLLRAEHWPFLCAGFTLGVLGHIMSTRVFTRAQAYRQQSGTSWRAKWLHAFFWWGRETLPAHPIAAGLVLALVWRDPEGLGWSWAESAAAWTFTGAASMFAWLAIKAAAKHRGIALELPGSSHRPPPTSRSGAGVAAQDGPSAAVGEASQEAVPDADTRE